MCSLRFTEVEKPSEGQQQPLSSDEHPTNFPWVRSQYFVDNPYNLSCLPDHNVNMLQGTQFQPNIYQGHKNKFIITTKWVYFFFYKPCITIFPLVINLYMFYLPLIQVNFIFVFN